MPVLVGNGEQVIFPSCNGVNTSAPELLLYLITSLAVQRFGLDVHDPPLSVPKALETVLAAGATAEDPFSPDGEAPILAFFNLPRPAVLTFLWLAFFAPLIQQEQQEQQESQEQQEQQEAQALHAMQNSFMVAHS